MSKDYNAMNTDLCSIIQTDKEAQGDKLSYQLLN